MLTDNSFSKKCCAIRFEGGSETSALTSAWNGAGNDAKHGVERKFYLEEMRMWCHAEGNGWSSRVVVLCAADPGGSEWSGTS